jgi:tRNA(Arg) A34 adenosine deaminase TadA
VVEQTMDVAGWVRKQLEDAHPDLLRAMVQEMAEALMGAEADALCGAGSLLVDSEGEVVLEAANTAVAGGDLLGHAELNLARAACSQFGRDFLQGCTLYTSTEPCAMCAGAIYWSGIGRVVYALSSETLEAIVNDEEGESRLALRCREVFASGGRSVQVEGPLLEDRAREVHQNFW